MHRKMFTSCSGNPQKPQPVPENDIALLKPKCGPTIADGAWRWEAKLQGSFDAAKRPTGYYGQLDGTTIKTLLWNNRPLFWHSTVIAHGILHCGGFRRLVTIKYRMNYASACWTQKINGKLNHCHSGAAVQPQNALLSPHLLQIFASVADEYAFEREAWEQSEKEVDNNLKQKCILEAPQKQLLKESTCS